MHEKEKGSFVASVAVLQDSLNADVHWISTSRDDESRPASSCFFHLPFHVGVFTATLDGNTPLLLSPLLGSSFSFFTLAQDFLERLQPLPNDIQRSFHLMRELDKDATELHVYVGIGGN